MKTILINMLSDNPKLIPTRGSPESAGLDLKANVDFPVVIDPGEMAKIHTGVRMAIPKGHVGLVFARSGVATKRRLDPANAVGVIDSDYAGEIIVALRNTGTDPSVVDPESAIAQLVIMPCELPRVDLIGDEDFDAIHGAKESNRGAGGFGSTDSVKPVELDDVPAEVRVKQDYEIRDVIPQELMDANPVPPDCDACLVDAFCIKVSKDEFVVFGKIYGDKKERFLDGRHIRTSASNRVSGDRVHTRNSVYRIVTWARP